MRELKKSLDRRALIRCVAGSSISLALPVLTLSACGGSGLAGAFAPPRVALSGLAFGPFNLSRQLIRARLDLFNPNPIQLPLSALEFGLDLEGEHIGRSTVSTPFSLNSQQSQPVTNDLVINLLSLAGLVPTLMQRPTLNYALDGQARLSNLVGGVALPFAHRGQVDVFRTLEALSRAVL